MDETRRLVVIGAGLAGCATAEAFSRRGWQVQVLEQWPQPGGAVIGLPLVAQHPALTPDNDLRSRLLVGAMQLHAALRAGPARDLQPAFERCGRFQPMEAARARRCLSHVSNAVARFVQQPTDGLWFPECAAVSPARWWQQVCKRPAVQLRTGITVARLHRQAGRWRVLDASSQTLADAPVVVLACREQAFALAGMDEADHGRLRLSPGRVWTARADGGPPDEDPGSPALRPIIGGDGLRLERPGHFWLHNDEHHQRWLQGQVPLEPSPPDDGAGPPLHAIQAFIGRPESWHPGRIGERLQLRDNLPMIGPAPDTAQVAQQAGQLARNDRLPLPRQPGLYLLCGLAGRGSLYAAIGAEMIAAHACHEAPVVDAALARATDPGRFIKRRLQRAWSQRGRPSSARTDP